jgi:hypothetical protein
MVTHVLAMYHACACYRENIRECLTNAFEYFVARHLSGESKGGMQQYCNVLNSMHALLHGTGCPAEFPTCTT